MLARVLALGLLLSPDLGHGFEPGTVSAETPTGPGAPGSVEDARRLLRAGDAGSAERAFRQALASDPESADAKVGVVQSLLARDRWQDALVEARGWAESSRGSPDLQGVLGEALFRAGRLRDAEVALEAANASSSCSPRTVLALALLRATRGAVETAAALAERAVTAEPEDREILFRAADVVGSRARSVDLLRRYLARSEGDDPDRIEAARGSLGVLSALGDREVWVRIDPPETTELPIRALGRGGRTRGWTVEATIGKKGKVRLLLDTGSTGLFLVERAVRKRGFTPLGEETIFAGGGKGRQRDRRGVVASLDIGPLRFRDALVTVTSAEIDPSGAYQGILGLQPFEGYRVVLDLARSRLRLGRSGPLEGGSAYWSVAGQLLVEAQTSCDAGGLFLLDTGASSSVIAKSAIEGCSGVESVPWAPLHGYGGVLPGAGAVRGHGLRFHNLKHPGGSLPVVDLSSRSRLGGVEVSGFLGLDLLDGSRIVIDTSSRAVCVQTGNQEDEAETRIRSGM